METKDNTKPKIKVFQKACALALATSISLGTVKLVTGTYPYMIDKKENSQTIFHSLNSNGKNEIITTFDGSNNMGTLIIYEDWYNKNDKYYRDIKTYKFVSAHYSLDFIKRVVSSEIVNIDKLFGKPNIISEESLIIPTENSNTKREAILIYKDNSVKGMGLESDDFNVFTTFAFNGMVITLYTLFKIKLSKDKTKIIKK